MMENNNKELSRMLDMMAIQHNACLAYFDYAIKRACILNDSVNMVNSMEDIKNNEQIKLQCYEYSLFLTEMIDNLSCLKKSINVNYKSFITMIGELELGIDEKRFR